eukprot:7256140-Prymnesium_polylepis.1
MDFIVELFRNGLGGLDSVLPQFQSVQTCCVYLFDLEGSALKIVYAHELKKSWTVLNEEEVLDFEQRLGFVQHEEKAQGHDIQPFLIKLQEHRRALTLMCELHVLGHPKFTLPVCMLTSGNVPGNMVQSLPVSDYFRRLLPEDATFGALEATRDSWKENLDHVLGESKLLCFFSSLTAQRLAMLIEDRSVHDLALLLSPLFQDTKDNIEHFQLLEQR